VVVSAVPPFAGNNSRLPQPQQAHQQQLAQHSPAAAAAANIVTVSTATAQPRLPQHPLPPTVSAAAVVTEPENHHHHHVQPQLPQLPPHQRQLQQQQQQPPTRSVALKKRDLMMQSGKKAEEQLQLQQLHGVRKLPETATAADKVTVESVKTFKPRDAFGGGAHLRGGGSSVMQQDESEKVYHPHPHHHQQQSEQQAAPAAAASPGAAYPPEHLQVMRARQDIITSEFNYYFATFAKTHPEQLALQLAYQLVEQSHGSGVKNGIAVALTAHTAAAAATAVPRPGSVPPSQSPSIMQDLQHRQQQPPMAHSGNVSMVSVNSAGAGDSAAAAAAYRSADSPLVAAAAAPAAAAHVHSRANAFGGLPPPTDLTAAAAYHLATDAAAVAAQPAASAAAASPRPPPVPLSSPISFPNLESYPLMWHGHLGLKSDLATVQFHYVSGCRELARVSLPDPAMAPTLKIGQRMRLEDNQLDGVQRKMAQEAEHCILLALPCNPGFEKNSVQLRNSFITYLQLKGAAGIVNVEGSDKAQYVVHVFPSCDFANSTMQSIAPDLLARVAEIEHMVIIIATVFDK